ncbi:recombination regulator RecX [Gammaproteobacteria bacterium]|nr:recombination regulator RecX [Gammaproteobacteria bacterium]
MNEEFFATVYNKALDIVSRREHSEKEIKNKLLEKFDAPEIIEQVVLKLIENNLINDVRFAEMYVLVRKRKGFGPKKIQFELMARGIDDSISSLVITEEGSWEEAAQKAFNKKFKNGASQEFKERNKQKTFLQNRGFSFEEIDSVFG